MTKIQQMCSKGLVINSCINAPECIFGVNEKKNEVTFFGYLFLFIDFVQFCNEPANFIAVIACYF